MGGVVLSCSYASHQHRPIFFHLILRGTDIPCQVLPQRHGKQIRRLRLRRSSRRAVFLESFQRPLGRGSLKSGRQGDACVSNFLPEGVVARILPPALRTYTP